VIFGEFLASPRYRAGVTKVSSLIDPLRYDAGQAVRLPIGSQAVLMRSLAI
jgi:hypothetical protein